MAQPLYPGRLGGEDVFLKDIFLNHMHWLSIGGGGHKSPPAPALGRALPVQHGTADG